MYVCMYLPTPHAAQADCKVTFILKSSLIGLNPKLSFSYTGFHTKVKEPSLSNYLPIAGARIPGFIPVKHKQLCPGLELGSPCLLQHEYLHIYVYKYICGYIHTHIIGCLWMCMYILSNAYMCACVCICILFRMRV